MRAEVASCTVRAASATVAVTAPWLRFRINMVDMVNKLNIVNNVNTVNLVKRSRAQSILEGGHKGVAVG